jgi:hypothetical protein
MRGSCLRLARISGRATADVFRLADRANNLVFTQAELIADAGVGKGVCIHTPPLRVVAG